MPFGSPRTGSNPPECRIRPTRRFPPARRHKPDSRLCPWMLQTALMVRARYPYPGDNRRPSMSTPLMSLACQIPRMRARLPPSASRVLRLKRRLRRIQDPSPKCRPPPSRRSSSLGRVKQSPTSLKSMRMLAQTQKRLRRLTPSSANRSSGTLRCRPRGLPPSRPGQRRSPTTTPRSRHLANGRRNPPRSRPTQRKTTTTAGRMRRMT